MLNRIALLKAGELAEHAGYAGRKISPRSSSPLANLVGSIKGIEPTTDDDTLIDRSVKSISTTGTHDEQEAQYVRDIGSIISNLLKTAKNEINPLCEQLVSDVQKRREANVLGKLSLMGDIKCIELEPLFTDAMFLDLVEPYINTPANIVRVNELDKAVSQLSSEERDALITTGSAGLDGKAKTLLNNTGWYINGVVDPNELGVDTAVYAFLLLAGIKNGRLESVNYIADDAKLMGQLVELYTACGGIIGRYIRSYETDIKNKTIVIIPPRTQVVGANDIWVNGANYRDWIQNAGGSPEAVLGFLMCCGRSPSYTDNSRLASGPEEFRLKYDERVKHLNNINILDDVKDVKECVERSLTDYINTTADEESRIVFHTRLAKAVKHEYYGVGYLHTYIVKVVCRTLTSISGENDDEDEIKSLLLEGQAILDGSPEMSIDKAMWLATIRLIAKWLVKDLVVTKA